MDRFATLIEILRDRAFQKSNQIAYTFLKNGETEEVSLSYQQLDLEARAIASHLQSLGATGERALLLYPPGLEFISAFLGCLYAGVVAVPAYPPRRNMNLLRLQAIAQDAEATFALTTTSVIGNIQDWLRENPNLGQLHWLATDSIDSDIAQSWHEPIVRSDTLALLQYTSGSTDTPKGVMVTHGNLLSNCADLDLGWNHTPESIIVTWLPTFHDMGLIYGVIEPLYKGCSCYMMSPVSFLQKPVRWLQAISTYQATHSGAPNFAYDLSVDKITPEQKATLNLSSWRMALNGAEPVRADVLQRFAETFKPCGFDLTAFCPGYGLAEATLKVAAVRQQDIPVFLAVDGDALAQNRVVAASSDAPNVQTLVGCGRSEIDTEIAIVHPESLTQCQAAEVGEIWISGSGVAAGYWRQTEQTAQTFQAYLADTGAGPFLRTGDLGFLQDGELFVTGRLKDIIIIRGQNHYPQDIELTVQKSHPALRLNCGAAFTIEKKGEERLVVVQEVERTYLRRLNIKEVVGNIKEAVIDNHGLQVYTTVLIKPGSIPKTSSGKIQRHACRHRFLEGSLPVVEDWKESSQNNAEFQNLDADVNSLLTKVQPDNPEPKRANFKQNVEVNIT
ncbi:fatty acyl-AMP ligase [Limnofasciculus baicalensis]|uniref:Fatty acyl-AMP ligase n=1 Tax=Limnofasciculus baicalensis BBK-W-15 TaxID=2699891 RepID=A0AAE3GQ02_9CYAN|nr:fatty acyl-AMP ligase [Limnofasciculus baicalensis]MCP2728621.1 fatty acyl-AMP ligase [Limnofasciculus baicalensis BBK-W-15]